MSSEVITRNDLENILNEIVSVRTDYIVEQGTSGIWTYRKWNSGIAECWGEYSYSVTGNGSVWASPLYIQSYAPQQNYPFEFIEIPLEWAEVSSNASACWLYHESGNSNNTKAKTAIYRPVKVNAFGNSTLKIRYYVKGRWK